MYGTIKDIYSRNQKGTVYFYDRNLKEVDGNFLPDDTPVKSLKRFIDGDDVYYEAVLDYVDDLDESNSMRFRKIKRKRFLRESISKFPEWIFIVEYPLAKPAPSGYLYRKDYEHDGGGCYYSSEDNHSAITGSFVSLYPDGHLTYLWNGIEKPLEKDWFVVNKK